MARRGGRIGRWIAVVLAGAAVLVLEACAAKAPVSAVRHQGRPELAGQAAEGTLSSAERKHVLELAHLPPVAPPKAADPPVDHSGRTEKGKASYYGGRFGGRTMANGKKFNPHGNEAASKTLPLGTTAKVVNRANGKSAKVTIQDRGPHIDGRIIDLSPKVAKQLDMKKKGVVPVEVKPIAVPQPSGKVTLGAGAAEASPEEVQKAVQTTKSLPKH
ncbi:MAG: septal ring lytic transglycosylase RlpA family protein [Acetobacteraceae bacterium]